MNFFLIILFTFIYSIDLNQWNNTKSILSPNKLIKNDNFLYGSTPGGLFIYDSINQNFSKEYMPNFCNELVQFNQSENGDFWFLCENGILYNNSNLMINYLDIDKAIDFIIQNQSIFILYENENISGIIRLNFTDDEIFFEDYYEGFTINYDTEFVSISIIDSKLFLSTDEGFYYGDINNNLKFASNWTLIDEVGTPIDMIPNEDTILLIFNDHLDILAIDSFSINSTINFDLGDYIDFAIYDELFYLLGNEKIIFFNNSFNIINEYIYNFNSAQSLFVDSQIYVGAKDQGFWDVLEDEVVKCSPNTLLSNDIEAITYNNGNLYGVNRNGVFILNEEDVIINLLSYNEDRSYLNNSDLSGCNFFNGIQLDYIPGDKISSSIVFNGEKVYIPNSGILPDENNNQGGLVVLNTQDFSVHDIIGTSQLDGLGGIYFNDIDNNYMTINQVKADDYGKIWIVNPYAEHSDKILVYYDLENDSWGHIISPDQESYLPQEIAFDKWGRIWISFRDEPRINSDETYSNGGIKLVTQSGVWLDVENLSSLPGDDSNVNIWSIDFGKFEGNDILWVLSSNGVQGYSINGSRIDPIYPIDFFTNIPFIKGDKIRVDAQNNVWITTSHSGVRVIKNDISFWPTEEGFTVDNSEILSNVVRDIAFNNNEGIAYLATNLGLSVLGIPFEKNKNNSNVGVTPNPFIVGEDEYILIDNMFSGSMIKVMTLSGIVVKKIDLPYNENKINWDGRNSKGEFLDSGVYLIVVENKEYGNGVTKLAIIR